MPSREREHGGSQRRGLKRFELGVGGLGEEQTVQIGVEKATGLHGKAHRTSGRAAREKLKREAKKWRARKG